MFFVYSRHTPQCDHKGDLKYRRCRCPKWIDGYTDGKRVRQSAQTRSWEQAERKARVIEDAADPSKQQQPLPTTIAGAVEAFMADEKGRSLKGNDKAVENSVREPVPFLGEAPRLEPSS